MLVKKDNYSIKITFSKDDVKSSSDNDVIYEDENYLISISRLEKFLISFEKIKPYEILKDPRKEMYIISLPVIPENQETKISLISSITSKYLITTFSR